MFESKLTNRDIKILDCTFRDGGHLLNWKFKQSTVDSVMSAISKSGIDYFEIGYRSSRELSQYKDIGQYALCNEDYLHRVKEEAGIKNVTVMMDTGKAKKSDFIEKSDSAIDTIRVATYAQDIDLAIEHVEDLYSKGYEVFINLMALSHIDKSKQIEILKKVDKLGNNIAAFYFADSFGSMFPGDIKNIINTIQDNTDVEIGFHGHNNLQMAIPNSLVAIEYGAKYIDSTLYGQGRGAGNLPTEIICAYLNSFDNTDRFDIDCLVRVIQDIFLGCADRVDWGYSLESFITGVTDSHPHRISELRGEGLSLIESFNILKE